MENSSREFEEYLDKNILVLLRDGSYMFGVLKSYDQYNSISLNFTIQRIFDGDRYAEKKLGLVSLRGESIVFIGICDQPLKYKQKIDYETLLRELGENK